MFADSKQINFNKTIKPAKGGERGEKVKEILQEEVLQSLQIWHCSRGKSKVFESNTEKIL